MTFARSVVNKYNLQFQKHWKPGKLAKNQVCAIFHMRDIQKNVLPKFIKLCLETPCLCPFQGHKRGQTWPPETNRNICFWVFPLMREFFAWGTHYCFYFTIIKIQNWKLSCLHCLRVIKISWRKSIEPVLACFKKMQHDFFFLLLIRKKLVTKRH